MKGTFPHGFLWGVAVAGYQVEGGDPQSVWARWQSQGRTADPIGLATDSWHRYEEDLALAAKMGATSFRLSVEWSRVEPRRGIFDQGAIARYVSIIDSCRRLGMEPVVTLYHFSYPQWLDAPIPGQRTLLPIIPPFWVPQDKDPSPGTSPVWRGRDVYGNASPAPPPFGEAGWERDAVVPEYLRYVGVVARALKGKVRFWITINEPNVEPGLGYLLGVFPPGKMSPIGFVRTLDHMAHAHVGAYDLLHRIDPHSEVSTNVFRMVTRQGDKTSGWFPLFDRGEAMLDELAHWHDRPGSPERCALDYLAFDYYYAFTLPEFLQIGADWRWPVYPRGLYDSATYYYNRYHLPVLVAENGMATRKHQQREDGWTREAFLVNHIYELQRAVQDGVPVLGYFYWSLMDNYEWGSYTPSFGLYEVDRDDPSLKRIPTGAVEVFKRIMRSNAIPKDLLVRYLGRKS